VWGKFLCPVSKSLSPNTLSRTQAGGEVLVKFIEATQAGVRPRKEEHPLEDHG
jgi:hypothetical protein